MDFVSMVLSGIIFGLTAFLPISGWGHLSLVEQVPWYQYSEFLLAGLDFGAIILVMVVFKKDYNKKIVEYANMCKDMLKAVKGGFLKLFHKESEGPQKESKGKHGQRKLNYFYLGAIIPSILARILLQYVIGVAKSHLVIVGMCFFINGIVLLIADNLNPGEKRSGDSGFGQGVLCGFLMGLAFLPGLSIYAFGISAALLLGYRRNEVGNIVYVMSVPVLVTDFVIRLLGCDFSVLAAGELLGTLLAVVLEVIVGMVTIRLTVLIVKQKKFTVLAIENLFIGITTVALLYFM